MTLIFVRIFCNTSFCCLHTSKQLNTWSFVCDMSNKFNEEKVKEDCYKVEIKLQISVKEVTFPKRNRNNKYLLLAVMLLLPIVLMSP